MQGRYYTSRCELTAHWALRPRKWAGLNFLSSVLSGGKSSIEAYFFSDGVKAEEYGHNCNRRYRTDNCG